VKESEESYTKKSESEQIHGTKDWGGGSFDSRKKRSQVSKRGNKGKKTKKRISLVNRSKRQKKSSKIKIARATPSGGKREAEKQPSPYLKTKKGRIEGRTCRYCMTSGGWESAEGRFEQVEGEARFVAKMTEQGSVGKRKGGERFEKEVEKKKEERTDHARGGVALRRGLRSGTIPWGGKRILRGLGGG